MSYKLDRKGSKRIIEDLHLKDIHLGKDVGELTGNVFWDKPWVVRFEEKDIASFEVRDTIYNVFKNYALEHLDDPSVYVFETKKRYTYRELLELVDRAAVGFKKIGINENSKVGIMLNGSVEEAVSLLALSKIGAAQKYIDYMKSIPAMKHNLEEVDLDLLIMDEGFLPLNPIINEANIPIVIANARVKHDNQIMYDNLYQDGNIDSYPYQEGKATIMISSSGTTGPAKPINHTDYTVNSAAQKMLYTDYPLGKGNVLVKMIPSQIGLGLITTLYTGLISGTLVCIIGTKDGTPGLIKNQNEFIRDFKDFKKKYGLDDEAKVSTFTAPLFIREIVNDKDITDLSYVGTMLGAGSKMEKGELDELLLKAKNKGYKGELCNGYGQNELAGAVTLNQNKYNLNGSGGFPTIGTNVIIVDSKTLFPTGDPDVVLQSPTELKLVGLNEIGSILEQSDSEFKEYHNMPDKTKKAYITMPDGSRWYNTYDLGYMDDDYFVHITGRMTRVVTRADFKYSLDSIEAKLRSLPYIKNCATIITQIGGSNELFAMFFEPNNGLSEEEVINLIKKDSSLSSYEIPDEFYMIDLDKMPYLSSGKIDYQYFKNLYTSLQGKSRIRK